MPKRSESSKLTERESPCPPWSVTLTSFINEKYSDRQHFSLELTYLGVPIPHEMTIKGTVFPAGFMVGRKVKCEFIREKIVSEVLDLDGYLLGMTNKKDFMNLPKEIRNLIASRIMGQQKRGFRRIAG